MVTGASSGIGYHTAIALAGAGASRIAILSANYVARRLEPHFPVLYTGSRGWVAHECIIDVRPLEQETSITAENVAKRLMDYGSCAG